MTRTFALNSLAALLSVAASAWFALPTHGAKEAQPDSAAAAARAGAELAAAAPIVREHGKNGLRDASGHFVPLGDYRRIASTSGVSDSLLLALTEPERIVAFTRFSVEDSPFAYLFSGKPTLPVQSNLEAVIALKPDLVVTNDLNGSARVDRLREAGLRVFDLGEMRGLRTLLPQIVEVATLVGRPEAGRALAARFARRMSAVAHDVPESARPRGLYLAIYGDKIYGGTIGTSYYDVLTAGGVRDAAAERYHDWQRYTPEALLALDPELVITHTGMRIALCAHSGLAALRVCGRGGRVVEINGTLLDDPSLTMLEAAESVFEAVCLSRE